MIAEYRDAVKAVDSSAQLASCGGPETNTKRYFVFGLGWQTKLFVNEEAAWFDAFTMLTLIDADLESAFA